MTFCFPDVFIDTKSSENPLHKELLESLIKKHYPSDLFAKKQAFDTQEIIDVFEKSLPAVFWSDFGDGYFSCTVFSEFRPEVFKFLFEIVARWLLPGFRINIETIFVVDFSFCERKQAAFNLSELKFCLKDLSKIQELRQNFEKAEKQLKLGVASRYQAQHILDVNGLSCDQKTALMQEKIAGLIQKRPKDFDFDLLTEMQRFLVLSGDSFKDLRECRHMCRIICSQYLFRKEILQQVKKNSAKRYLSLKCMRSHLHCENGLKPILALVLGINFLKSNERFEERHLLRALQHFLPGAKPVEGSFFQHGGSMEKIHTMYVELYREEDFRPEEIKRLRKDLPTELKHYIEHLMHPIFMPCNEEEILRNILILSDELKYLRDIPQVIISFEEQNDFMFSFRVTLLRVLQKNSKPLEDFFTQSVFSFSLEQQRIVGYLRKKYPKEASVFRLELKKSDFLRADHSLDLYKARNAVASEISEKVGEFRDFNGGMISKQNELLSNLKKNIGTQNEFLLENFFYSLKPLVMRSILEPQPLKSLFLMVQDLLKRDFSTFQNYFLSSKLEGSFLLLLICAKDQSLEAHLKQCLAKMRLAPLDLASTSLVVNDLPCFGYIYRIENEEQGESFEMSMQECLKAWKSGSQTAKELSLV